MNITDCESRQKTPAGFTLVELLSVLAVISILGCLLLPAMARTRVTATSAGCLSNFRQMMVGWAAYKDDNSDTLVPNAVGGGGIGWCKGAESWQNIDGNTNRLDYLLYGLGPYLSGHIEVYRCPADVIPSDNGQRLRSCSMNGMIGTSQGVANNPGWREYYTGSDLTCPGPNNTFIFADESMSSLNDGYLQMNLNTPLYPDITANYHDGACGISFADGHAEIHKWMWAGTVTSGLRSVPYAYNGNHNNWPSSTLDVDWLWLRARSACNHP